MSSRELTIILISQGLTGFAFIDPADSSETDKWMRELAEHGDGTALSFPPLAKSSPDGGG
ncbi:hypothetical protein [Salinibacterium sp. PAMC 21357]|uniref:hypothetical protein n=1 Tax=Salinibacterium sp. PAMC 21357 TaxID=1112215 RepID=UPI0002FDE8C3|nr:hypothetical protein [Salinibacterium sp. PAMC 21357]